MCKRSYLDFEYLGKTKSGKTKIYSVRSSLNSSYKFGTIKWFSRWCKYCFFTDGYANVFDDKCLDELNDFIKQLNTEHKKQNKSDRKKDGNPHAQCY